MGWVTEAVSVSHRSVMQSPQSIGFLVIPGVIPEGMESFVDGVIPILQQRGLFRTEYEGETLRENLGVDHQYGLQRRPRTP